jgi:SAM-dependent methyltransferase
MCGDDRVAPTTDPPTEDGHQENPLRKWAKALYAMTPWALRGRTDDLQHQLDAFRAVLPTVERRLDDAEEALRTIQAEFGEALQTIQGELVEVRDRRLRSAENRVDTLEQALFDASSEITRLRDEALPVSVARSDALVGRLAEELEEVASLVERSLRGEPLPVVDSASVSEDRLAESLKAVQPLLLESFRGSDQEIRHRLDRYLPDLQASPPVLDLGCGRGELLLLLREAGVEAAGIEGDAALAGAVRRRGLEVIEGDVLDALRDVEDDSRGAVTAIHLFEHLATPVLVAVLAEIRRVLRCGGILIAECPNPHSLRVGGSLFWQDPTHLRPLLPETLELYLRAAGFSPSRREFLNPFPADQLFEDDEGGTRAETDSDVTAIAERLDRLRRRLDEVLNGPRDFVVWAVVPEEPPQN